MAEKKKFYSVAAGRTPGIYLSWEECKAQVNGFSGAVFRSFSSREEAEEFLRRESGVSASLRAEQPGAEGMPKEAASPGSAELNQRIKSRIDSLLPDEALAFTDGSYNEKTNTSAYGVIYFTADGGRKDCTKSFCESACGHEFMAQRNVSAELEGVKEAVRLAEADKKAKIAIYYDYQGIGCWAKGEWQCRTPITKAYADFLQEAGRRIQIEWHKVPAHAAVLYNEQADQLAKSKSKQPFFEEK